MLTGIDSKLTFPVNILVQSIITCVFGYNFLKLSVTVSRTVYFEGLIAMLFKITKQASKFQHVVVTKVGTVLNRFREPLLNIGSIVDSVNRFYCCKP